MKANFVFSGMSVDNIQTAKEFYTQTLGLELVDESMGLRFALPNGGSLFMYEKPDHQAAAYTALNFVVSDIDAAVNQLANAGVSMEHYDNLFAGAEQDEKGVLRSPDVSKYGPTIAWFKDPAGNTIALIQDDK